MGVDDISTEKLKNLIKNVLDPRRLPEASHSEIGSLFHAYTDPHKMRIALCLIGIDGDKRILVPVYVDLPSETYPFVDSFLVGGLRSPYAAADHPDSGGFLIDPDEFVLCTKEVLDRLEVAATRAADLDGLEELWEDRVQGRFQEEFDAAMKSRS